MSADTPEPTTMPDDDAVIEGPLRFGDDLGTRYADVVPGELSELTVVVPLLDAAHARLGQHVTIWIADGIRLDGDLRAVEDDDTLVMIDGGQRYDIALQSVAVIQGKA